MERIMNAKAQTQAAAKTVTVKVGKKSFEAPTTNASLITETTGVFSFTRAADVELHDSHVVARPQAVVTPVTFPAKAVTRTSRERFSEDDALLNFIRANGWEACKTQRVLDNVRAKGFSCSMARANRLLNRDAKGNALPAAEPVKAEA
jgi:hypothetical protein